MFHRSDMLKICVMDLKSRVINLCEKVESPLALVPRWLC